MSESGYIKLYRKFFSHELWKETREFSRAEAWLDLLYLVEFVHSSKLIRGKWIDVRVGELVASGRYLAKRWGWSHKKARNFLEMLEQAHQITQRRAHGENIITLVNYRVYNGVDTQKGTPKGTLKGTEGAQGGHKYKESKEGKEITPSNARPREEGFTREQVLEAARLPDVAVSEAEARKFFDHYNGEWTYGNGKPITCLATALRRWKGKQEQFQQKGRNHGNENNGAGRPNRNAGTYNDNDEPAVF